MNCPLCDSRGVSQKPCRLKVLKIIITLTAASLAPDRASIAAQQLPAFFTDNMVLQRNASVPIWGTARPGEVVTVKYGGQEISTKASDDGDWLVRLDPMEANAQGRELSAGPGVKLTNVVVGDVWVCSGQSNIQMGLVDTQNARDEIANANYPLIRQVKISPVSTNSPQNNATGSWRVCSPSTAGEFTAVGYYFAKALQFDLHVPIGIVNATFGGTRIERWIAPEGLRMVPALEKLSEEVDATTPTTLRGHIAYQTALDAVTKWLPVAEQALQTHHTPPDPPQLPMVARVQWEPTTIYNGMIHPLIPFGIRGVVWYQGESNEGEGLPYFHMMQALIYGWRKVWNQGDFPFYFVQLPNYQEPSADPSGGGGYSWAPTREAQRRSLALKNTGMAVTIDLGDAGNIHPKDKQTVGARLALWALAREYGKTNIVFSGPLYSRHEIEGGSIRVYFDNTGTGLMVGKKSALLPSTEDHARKLQRFAIAGADRKWYWAEARIDGTSVVVFSPNVAHPVAVRYAYSMNPEGCNLFNQEGLPASPFRTDDW
jgi:sialate O-acetylesterase